MVDGTLEDAVVVGAADVGDMVARRLRRAALEEFLQFALGVVDDGDVIEAGEGVVEMLGDEFLGGGITSIQENGADHRFESIGEGGGAFAAAVGIFASAQQQVLTEAQAAALFGEGPPVDQFGAGLGERPFAKGGKTNVKVAREDKLQHGVAEKLKALIVLRGRALFVRDGGMRQRELEQREVGKRVAQSELEFTKIIHRTS